MSAPLVLDGGAGLSAEEVRSAFDLQQSVRLLAGPFMALFLLSVGVSNVLPRPLPALARAIAVPLALTPVAAFADVQSLHVAAVVAFGLHALWIWLASLWLAVGGGVRPVVLLRRAAFLMLVVAAGLVGVALLVVPGSTGVFFSWGLGPESLAAFAGGVYVGSAVLYGVALRAPWRRARARRCGRRALGQRVRRHAGAPRRVRPRSTPGVGVAGAVRRVRADDVGAAGRRRPVRA